MEEEGKNFMLNLVFSWHRKSGGKLENFISRPHNTAIQGERPHSWDNYSEIL